MLPGIVHVDTPALGEVGQAGHLPVGSTGTTTDRVTTFTHELIEHGLLIPTGVRGLVGKSGVFEAIVAGIDQLVTSAGRALNAEVVRFPPMIPRALLERSEYLGAFPQLIGSVHSFTGDDAAHAELMALSVAGADWGAALRSTEVVMTPAACYPVYGMSKGTLPRDGRTFDVSSYCFRHEPSDDPARMQLFRMHEFVRLGSSDDCSTFRDAWMVTGEQLLSALGLAVECVPANDPFFGRRGRLMRATQREQALKFELVVPIVSTAPTAVASANWHQDHFGELFGIHQQDGTVAHTACVGFGLERITLALLQTHGLRVAEWPDAVRHALSV